LQREIVQAILREAKVALTPQERAAFKQVKPVDREVYDAYLRGLFHWSKRTPEGLRNSSVYFQQAIAKDKSYAPAYVSLAKFYQYSSEYGVLTSRESLPKAKVAAMKALAIDNSLADGHAVLAMALVEEYDWYAAEKEYQLALELNPGSAEVHYSYAIDFLSPLGRHTEAISQMQRAQELDPLSPIINANLGVVYLLAGQHDQAVQQCFRTLEIAPNLPSAHMYLSFAYEKKGMYDESISELQKTIAESYIPQALGELARVYVLAGRRKEALKARKDLVQLSARTYVSSYDLARVYLANGEKDRALTELERAYGEHSVRLIWLRVDWTFNDLHSEDRYQKLLERMHFPQADEVVALD